MAKLVVSENVSVDGVVEDPRGEGDLGRGDWFTGVEEHDLAAWTAALTAEMQAAAAVLLGRRSFEYFAARYPSRRGALADRFNALPKHVVSRGRVDASAWANATALPGDVVEQVAALKDRVVGELVVYASGRLVPTLIDHGLVDELRLTVWPTVVGAGRRLFGPTPAMRPLRLAGVRTVGAALVHLTYRPAARG